MSDRITRFNSATNLSSVTDSAGVRDVGQAKRELRAAVRQVLRRLTSEQRAQASVQACRRLRQQPIWSTAAAILFYAPRADELDIGPLIESARQEGKIVALPQFDPVTRTYRACQIETPLAGVPVGYFGIREPGEHCPSVALNQLDLLLVPGVAFDLGGGRLGRGRGYYDRLLTNLRGIKCGLGFDDQVVGKIPVEPHDILLDCILTPTCWAEVRPQRLGNDWVG